MSSGLWEHITSTRRKIHDLVLDVAESLSEEQLTWQPRPGVPSIGWHVWHVARTADFFHAIYLEIAEGTDVWHSPGRQVWANEGIARQWGLDPTLLGWEEIGTEMAEDVAATLVLPDKTELLVYARRAFNAFEQAVEQYHDQHTLDRSIAGFDGNVTAGWLILHELQHAGRHLGMIEALRGVAVARGSATG